MQCAICADVSLLALPLGFMPRCQSAAPLGQLLQKRPSANEPRSRSIACRNTIVHAQTATVESSPQLDSPSRLDGKDLKLIGEQRPAIMQHALGLTSNWLNAHV